MYDAGYFRFLWPGKAGKQQNLAFVKRLETVTGPSETNV
jgi:hypothetical protein